MGRPFYGNDVPRKKSITGESLGFRPQPVRARVQGETEDQYRKYVKGMQGDQARRLATAKGLDTSGMAWDGTQFKDANWEHWWEDPGVVGPAAVMISGGYGMGANGMFGSTVQGLLGGGATAAPTAAGTVGGFSIVPPTVAYGGSAAIPTAATGGGAMGWLGKLGLTVKDLFSGGAEIYDMISDNRSASKAAETQDRYLQMALDFAKSQYADQTKLEKERWDASEARRVPYRAASQDVLREFRNLLGLD